MSTAGLQSVSELPRIIIIMGVSGCGKTAIGERLAGKLGINFTEGDSFHPAGNVEKMRSGTPLNDEDRWPWLTELSHALHIRAEKNGRAVCACSALKRVYRETIIKEAGEPVLFIHLNVSRTELQHRVTSRQHEYMPAFLLDSQLETLEPLSPDEPGITIDANGSEDATFHLLEEALAL